MILVFKGLKTRMFCNNEVILVLFRAQNMMRGGNPPNVEEMMNNPELANLYVFSCLVLSFFFLKKKKHH
jgi:hypothetical protein